MFQTAKKYITDTVKYVKLNSQRYGFSKEPN